MKKSSIISVVIGALILAGAIYFFQSRENEPSLLESQQQSDQPVEIIVNYTGTSVGFQPQTTAVEQGQQVIVKIISPVADEAHLHGYDLFVDVEPSEEATLFFTADKTGRFELELEAGHVTLAVIEVLPK